MIKFKNWEGESESHFPKLSVELESLSPAIDSKVVSSKVLTVSVESRSISVRFQGI